MEGVRAAICSLGSEAVSRDDTGMCATARGAGTSSDPCRWPSSVRRRPPQPGNNIGKDSVCRSPLFGRCWHQRRTGWHHTSSEHQRKDCQRLNDASMADTSVVTSEECDELLSSVDPPREPRNEKVLVAEKLKYGHNKANIQAKTRSLRNSGKLPSSVHESCLLVVDDHGTETFKLRSFKLVVFRETTTWSTQCRRSDFWSRLTLPRATDGARRSLLLKQTRAEGSCHGVREKRTESRRAS